MVLSFGFEGDWLWEYWLQLYVKENASKYGMSIVKWLTGRGGGGGDFLVEINERKVKVEVEWLWSCYDHSNDPKYSDVRILMCLDLERPKKDVDLSRYPPEIIFIGSEDFSGWYYRKTGRRSKPYLKEAELPAYVKLFYGENISRNY